MFNKQYFIMKRLILMTLLLYCIMILPASAFAHKLIPTDGSNNDIVSALEIPDPVVSWAMYEELSNNALYYKFDAEKGDKLFASIVIPKLDGLENFSPSLVFIAPSFAVNPVSAEALGKYSLLPSRDLTRLLPITLMTLIVSDEFGSPTEASSAWVPSMILGIS